MCGVCVCVCVYVLARAREKDHLLNLKLYRLVSEVSLMFVCGVGKKRVVHLSKHTTHPPVGREHI